MNNVGEVYEHEKCYERSLNDIRESNAGDRLHLDFGFNGVDWLRLCQCSEAKNENIDIKFISSTWLLLLLFTRWLSNQW